MFGHRAINKRITSCSSIFLSFWFFHLQEKIFISSFFYSVYFIFIPKEYGKMITQVVVVVAVATKVGMHSNWKKVWNAVVWRPSGQKKKNRCKLRNIFHFEPEPSTHVTNRKRNRFFPQIENRKRNKKRKLQMRSKSELKIILFFYIIITTIKLDSYNDGCTKQRKYWLVKLVECCDVLQL